MTAPKVLGVEMCEPYEGCFTVRFGHLTASVSVQPFNSCEWVGRVAGSCVHLGGTLPDCIAAIERELLAIKSAIPDGPTTGGDDGQT